MKRAGTDPSAALVLLVLTGAACGGVSAEDIQTLKKTPEGRERLVKVLRDDGQALPRRAEAAAALAENGAVDRLESAVAAMPFDDRARVIPATAELLARTLDAREAGKSEDARDALFALRRQSTSDEGTRTVDAALLPALEKDLRAGRTEGGRYSFKEMVTTIGPAALPLVQRALDDPQAPYATPVEVLLALNDKPAQEKAGAALVARARSTSTVAPELLTAMSRVGGEAVTAYLQQRIEAADPQAAERAADALTRVGRNPALLPFALRVAKNGSASPKVREHMLTLVRNLGTEDARKGLLEALRAEPDPGFRFTIFQAAIDAGGGKAVLAALEALPSDAPYQPGEVKEKVVAPIYGLGWQAREGIFKALESKSPVARMFAVLVLEKSGLDGDAAPLLKLTKDRGTVKGFPRGQTVGVEANRVAATLKKPAS